jgi:hypothetical protein
MVGGFDAASEKHHMEEMLWFIIGAILFTLIITTAFLSPSVPC